MARYHYIPVKCTFSEKNCATLSLEAHSSSSSFSPSCSKLPTLGAMTNVLGHKVRTWLVRGLLESVREHGNGMFGTHGPMH
eukprot:161346-Pyramimonas_sp.AAC.1